MSKPKIKSIKSIFSGNIFTIESLDMQFANGQTRQYERIRSKNYSSPGNISKPGSVLIAAINSQNELLLVREYSAGLDCYVLAFPKGLIDPGEDMQAAAKRELIEEVGMSANNLQFLKQLAASPGYFMSSTALYLATDLSPESAVGDEPEPLEIIAWPMSDIDGLISHPEFIDARSAAALLLLQRNTND